MKNFSNHFHRIIILACAIPSQLLAQSHEEIIHYDNLDNYGGGPGAGNAALKIWNWSNDEPVAQRFKSNADNVTSVTLGLGRLGSPGGKLSIEIYGVDQATGDPGQRLGMIATLDLNSLPLVSKNPLPAFLDVFSFNGLVTGLAPGQDYFIYLDASDDAKMSQSASFVFSAVDTPFDASEVSSYYDAKWNPDPGRLYARVKGRPRVALSNPGNDSVTIEPQTDTYPLGTRVTVSATIEEGSEFTGWKAEKVTQPRHTNVYDNIEHKRDQSSHPEALDQLHAQQFIMDDNTTLGTVQVELFRKGTVSGSVTFELWSHDDATKYPGEKVADIGVIEEAGAIPTEDTEFTFKEPITSLTANAPYWIVANPSGIASTLDADNTIAWSVSGSKNTAGSNGRLNAHVRSNDNNTAWKSLGSTRFHQMRIKTLSNASMNR